MAEILTMEEEQISPVTIQVIRQMYDLDNLFMLKDIRTLHGWAANRHDIWTQLKRQGLIESPDEVITMRSQWNFTTKAWMMWYRFNKYKAERVWYRSCSAVFGDLRDELDRFRRLGKVKVSLVKVNNRSHVFAYLPDGPEALMQRMEEKISRRPQREPSTELVSQSSPVKVKPKQVFPLSKGEILSQGKPADVINMLKPIATAQALWVRAKCKLYEKERRLPESIIQEAREILGIYAPSCVPRFGYSPA